MSLNHHVYEKRRTPLFVGRNVKKGVFVYSHEAGDTFCTFDSFLPSLACFFPRTPLDLPTSPPLHLYQQPSYPFLPPHSFSEKYFAAMRILSISLGLAAVTLVAAQGELPRSAGLVHIPSKLILPIEPPASLSSRSTCGEWSPIHIRVGRR